MTRRGDFGRPATAPVPAAARDTWRDQIAVVLDGEYGSDVALIDAAMRVLVAAQREAAERSWDAGYAAAQLDADEEPYSDRPERATWQPRQNPHRASALRAGSE